MKINTRTTAQITRSNFLLAAALLALGLAVTGCSPSAKPDAAPPRPVKVATISADADTSSRVCAGLVRARNRMSLSFQVPGRITELPVEIGDTIRAGQRLAALDPKPFELRVLQAEADLRNAKATLAERQSRHAAEKQLFASGASSRVEFEQIEVTLAAAKSATDVAEAALNLARRDLENATLTSPLAGRVAQRFVQRFTDVAAGSTVLEVDGDGGLEVLAQVPEVLARELAAGDAARITTQGASLVTCAGRIAKVGTRTEAGLSVPVIVELTGDASALIPGSTVEVSFQLKNADRGIVVPMLALIAGPEKNSASVFVFDPRGQKISRRAISLGEPVGEGFRVSGGLQPGEAIVVAGVPFLTDGQKVRAASAEFNQPGFSAVAAKRP